MVDTLVSGASASRHVGSSPIIRTKKRLDFSGRFFRVLIDVLYFFFFLGGDNRKNYICSTLP